MFIKCNGYQSFLIGFAEQSGSHSQMEFGNENIPQLLRNMPTLIFNVDKALVQESRSIQTIEKSDFFKKSDFLDF